MAHLPRTRLSAALAVAALLVTLIGPPSLRASNAASADDTPTYTGHIKGPAAEEFAGEDEGDFAKLRDAYYETRRVTGDQPLTIEEAALKRSQAADAAAALRKQAKSTAAGSAAVATPWNAIGPNPIVQVARTSNTFEAVSGRISALAVNAAGKIYLGAAQGGIWTYTPSSGTWTSLTDNLPTLAVGDIALAPSNDAVIYLGSGEGNLSGDSYFGDGVYRSADGGTTWAHVSGSTFAGVSIPRIVVDPTNPNHLYAAVSRGRGGIRRTTPPTSTVYGIYESTDGGATWTLRKGTTNQFRGATDLEIDPQNPQVLYASFWGDQIYKSTNGGVSWAPAMTGLPAADYAGGATRFSIGISHPAGSANAVLYTGFDWFDGSGHHPSRVFRSNDNAASWQLLPGGSGGDAVTNYCATQCFYDNVIEADPTNPNLVFAAGQYDYARGSGGIYRSVDGGQTWKSVGFDLHPDFHALAFQASSPGHVVIGNDGGVWQSPDYGGRLLAGDPLGSVDWENLNGGVDPLTAGVTHRTGLQISQFSSIATVPTTPNRFWGGTQDNGTLRKSSASSSWFDVASGDGGQVLVDPNNANFVFGSYFGISPYRYSTGGLQFFSNESIENGIDPADRAEFYVPWVMNKGNTNQLFLGTYRLYRTDNAETASAGDVLWKPISPDLTSGCTGTAPNGARGCLISAVGVADGGDGVYTGSDDGLVYVSPDAVTSATPTWKRVDKGALPARPVTQFAVDRSNWRTAYAAYASFNGTTPTKPGHVFATGNGGKSWKDISANLPDAPVNSLVLDPSTAGTLYAGTDVGTFVTTDNGASWNALGSGLPRVAVWQLDLDSRNRVLAAGTHGRGAWRMNQSVVKPALVLSTTDSGVPVGAGTDLTYQLTVRNIGNADATGVAISDLIPVGTSFVSASDGGRLSSGRAVWSGLAVPRQGSKTVTLTVHISSALDPTVTQIVNDRISVTSAEGASTTGSPHSTPISSAHGVSLSPAGQTDGNRLGQPVNYLVHVNNRGFLADNYAMSSSGAFTSQVLDATCTSALATTASVAPGGTTDVCVRVTVATTATNAQADTTTVTATSTTDPTVSANATVTTIAVAVDTLLVDNDNGSPDVQTYYQAALTSAGMAHNTWDLSTSNALPQTYLNAHKNVVWFTGTSYPGPITPYESGLTAYLNSGGHLFMSGEDILDQAAGTTTFVRDYLHIAWDGSETQNDKGTAAVNGVPGNPVTDGIGVVPLDLTVDGGADYSDQITPIAPAVPAFTDTTSAPDALSVSTNGYKVVFLAFPFEAYGTAAQRADLLTRAKSYFDAP